MRHDQSVPPATDAPAEQPETTEQPETFQVSVEAAEAYERHFVPAIFAEWAPVILDAAGVTDRDRVLDVACGTGIVARTAAADRAQQDADVVGVDLNPAMLAVARRVAPSVEWREGDVADLPFPADHFDVAVCQMAAMFFPDRRRSMAEMARVTRPGGRLAWVVPSSLADQPAYGPFVDIAVSLTDESARALLGAYWSCGDREAFDADLEAAGLEPTGSRLRMGTARFDSPAGLVATEIDATPLAERIDADVRAKIVDEVSERLACWVEPGGPFEIPLAANVVTARVPER